MKVRMIETRSASIDGVHIIIYEAGTVCDLTPRLTEVFIENGWAEPAMQPAETKIIAPAETKPLAVPKKKKVPVKKVKEY